MDKMYENRIMRNEIEEQNEYGFGYHMAIHVEPDSVLSKYVSIDARWIAEGEFTEDGFGFLMSPKAARKVASFLLDAAYEAQIASGEKSDNKDLF